LEILALKVIQSQKYQKRKNHLQNENNISALVNTQKKLNFIQSGNFFHQLDSGHIQSESPSPIDLSPSSTSPSTKPEPMTYVS
jgi:hypothetical protein